MAVAPAAPAAATPPPTQPVVTSRVATKPSSGKKSAPVRQAGAAAVAATAPPVAPPTTAANVKPPAPAAAPAPPAPVEYITVECFSDPLGADIMIDDEFHGNTPSILKLPPGNHQLEYRLAGYKVHTEALTLAASAGIRTIKTTLEKQP